MNNQHAKNVLLRQVDSDNVITIRHAVKQQGYIDKSYTLLRHMDIDGSTKCPGKCLSSIIAGWPHFP
ncbi:hypothetical protein LSH36_747g01002 [Paralvinella palmiformis]|uniref:Uncharacterized protein n=1 Tax=Paralvinella palmiformis TaxID=53620 RepID=A0AAD9J2R0_9ANNE|nr:hypothetical protein LSH36_747g01002 [Paralvinella palmiformis]